MCGSESIGKTDEQLAKTEGEYEDAVSNEQGSSSSHEMQREYWSSHDDENVRSAWYEVEGHLDRVRSQAMASQAVEKIDVLQSREMNWVNERHADFDRQLSGEIETLQRSYREASEGERASIKIDIDRKVAAKDGLDKWRAYAHSTVEKFFTRYRNDLATGLRKPLWRRQKLWAWVGASVFACSTVGVGIATLIYTKQKDANAQRRQAELDLIARQNNIDKSTLQALTASVDKTKDALIQNALAKYLPWLRAAISNFKLGKASLMDLAYFFDINSPTDDNKLPISEVGNASIVSDLIKRYDTAAAPSYTTLIDALISMGSNGYNDDSASLHLKPETIAAWSAMQFNWILVGSLQELVIRFDSGLSKPPVS